MGILGKQGLFGLGSSLGGGGGIITPSDQRFASRITGEGGMVGELTLTRKLASMVSGEGDIVADITKFKSLASNVSGEGGLVGELASGFAFDNALEFDGVNDNVTFSSIAVGNTWCYSTWFKYDAFGGMIISDGGTDFIRAVTDTQFQVRTGTTKTYTVPTISTGAWYHLFVSVNSTSCRVYLNGVESSTGALTVASSANFTIIGSRTSDLYLDGVLDEMAIWNGTAGTGTNAVDLYNSGNGALASDVIASPTAYWRFNGSGTDTTLVDETGTYNGTLNNFTLPGAWVAH